MEDLNKMYRHRQLMTSYKQETITIEECKELLAWIIPRHQEVVTELLYTLRRCQLLAKIVSEKEIMNSHKGIEK